MKNKIRIKTFRMLALISLATSAIMAGCVSKDKISYTYPESPQDIRDENFGKILGKDLIIYGKGSVFSNNTDNRSANSSDLKEQDSTNELVGDKGKKVAVNSYLWQAAVETLANMPILFADPTSGIIATDWFRDNELGLRYKANIVVIGSAFRANALRINVFLEDGLNSKKVTDLSHEADDSIQEKISEHLEKEIMTRARSIKYYAEHKS